MTFNETLINRSKVPLWGGVKVFDMIRTLTGVVYGVIT